MYRFLVQGGFRFFDSYRIARANQLWLRDHGVPSLYIEVNCPVHGWTLALQGACQKCKEKNGR